jgi:hypothetical protein
MGVAEVVGFAVCWLVVAALMLWGVFTEKKRGPMRFEPPAGLAGPVSPPVSPAVSPPVSPLTDTGTPGAVGAGGTWHPARSSRPTPAEWVVIDVAQGATPDVADEARFLAGAWLAARGIDMATVPPADVRTEVTTTGDGITTTRVLVRATALQTSRRPR